MSLTWRGPAVEKKVEAAAIAGINETTGACVVMAMGLVHRRSGTLRGSIRIEPARSSGGRVMGSWGSFDVNYALWQEVSMKHGGKPYLRPSADAEYPKLGGRIRGHM